MKKNNNESNKSGKKDAVSHEKKYQKELQQQKINNISIQNEKKRQDILKKKQDRKVALLLMSKKDKKTFLTTEKEEMQKKKELAKTQKAKQRSEYVSLSPTEKKATKKERRKQNQLQKKAKKGYAVMQTAKYIILAVIAGVLVYAGNIAYGAFIDNSYAFRNTGQAVSTPSLTSTPQPVQTQVTTEIANTPEPTVDPYELLLSQADLDFMENRVNILLLGIDESLERANWRSFRTDTMILVSIDFETNDVYMVSLPRDSYVWIYNRDYRSKINTAFGSGGGKDGNGFEYAMNTVSMLLGGVPVNHYVCFDMNVVKEVVNAIGGLDYDVDIDVNMCGREIEKGVQYMDGQMVLDYCRQRKGSSDIARADRQQKMIFSIFEEIKNSGQIKDIPSIYSAVTGNIYTDLDLTQITSLAAFAMGIDMDNLQRFMLPGNFLNIDGTSFWGVNQYEKRDMVKEIFGKDIKISKDDHVTILKELVAQKQQLVSTANSTAASAEAYVRANSTFITIAERNDFNTSTLNLRTVAAVTNTKDVGTTIPPITTAINEYNTWFASFKAIIEAKKFPPTPIEVPTPIPLEQSPSTTAEVQ